MATKETRSARIRRLREAKDLSLLDVGKELGVEKATVSKWENHKNGAPDIELDVFFALADLLGIEPRELATGVRTPVGQGELELTPSAKTIAKIWDQLPSGGQEQLAEQIYAIFRLHQEDPDMAARIFTKPDQKRAAAHHKLMEYYQSTHRGPRR